MEEAQPNYAQIFGEINAKIVDIEEKQKILKNRMVLIGENLIDIKEDTNNNILSIKKELEMIKRNIEKMISFLETASGEFSKFARKEDVEILAKQIKMFKPLIMLNKEKN